MESVFSLPLGILAALQLLVALLLLAPKPVSLPVANLLKSAKRNVAANSVFMTVSMVLGGLMISSCMELMRGHDRAMRADVREVVATIDYLRAQLSCVLCTLNLLLLFLSRSLAGALCAVDHSTKNLDAMQRQVKGLQAEYERLSKASEGKGKDSADPAGGAQSEEERLRKRVNELGQEKQALKEAAEAAEKAKTTAEARVEAMLKQTKGFDQEFTRILEENAFLKRKLAGLGDPAFAAEVQAAAAGKKDK